MDTHTGPSCARLFVTYVKQFFFQVCTGTLPCAELIDFSNITITSTLPFSGWQGEDKIRCVDIAVE